jgi:hypothetical protein
MLPGEFVAGERRIIFAGTFRAAAGGGWLGSRIKPAGLSGNSIPFASPLPTVENAG